MRIWLNVSLSLLVNMFDIIRPSTICMQLTTGQSSAMQLTVYLTDV